LCHAPHEICLWPNPAGFILFEAELEVHRKKDPPPTPIAAGSQDFPLVAAQPGSFPSSNQSQVKSVSVSQVK
jgi:hypothetical protein